VPRALLVAIAGLVLVGAGVGGGSMCDRCVNTPVVEVEPWIAEAALGYVARSSSNHTAKAVGRALIDALARSRRAQAQP
jgi:hypothetical protein